MRYFLRPEKFLEVLALIQETISKLDQKFLFTARELASVLGNIHSLNRSHGSIVSVMTRHIQHVVGREVFYNGWTTQVSLDSRCRRELAFLQEHLIAFNGKLIPASKAGARVVCYEEISQLIQLICYSEEMVSNLIISDASDTTAFVFLKDKFVQTKEFEFDAEEQDLSSGHRELLATLKFLEDCKQNKVKFSSSIVYWQTDSKNNFIFLSRGSRKSRIQQDVVSIKFLERELGITIIPVWTPRSHSRIILADLGSKFSQSTDEWGIPRATLRDIFAQFHLVPTVDCFASEPNKVCDVFFSKIPQTGCSGINFFVQTLHSDQVYFCCPPVKEIVHTFKTLTSTANISSVLIIPLWNSANFWPFLHNGRNFRNPIVDHIVFQSEFLVFNKVDNIFAKKPNFSMVALKILS